MSPGSGLNKRTREVTYTRDLSKTPDCTWNMDK